MASQLPAGMSIHCGLAYNPLLHCGEVCNGFCVRRVARLRWFAFKMLTPNPDGLSTQVHQVLKVHPCRFGLCEVTACPRIPYLSSFATAILAHMLEKHSLHPCKSQLLQLQTAVWADLSSIAEAAGCTTNQSCATKWFLGLQAASAGRMRQPTMPRVSLRSSSRMASQLPAGRSIHCGLAYNPLLHCGCNGFCVRRVARLRWFAFKMLTPNPDGLSTQVQVLNISPPFTPSGVSLAGSTSACISWFGESLKAFLQHSQRREELGNLEARRLHIVQLVELDASLGVVSLAGSGVLALARFPSFSVPALPVLMRHCCKCRSKLIIAVCTGEQSIIRKSHVRLVSVQHVAHPSCFYHEVYGSCSEGAGLVLVKMLNVGSSSADPAAAACQLSAVSTAPRLRCHLAAARRVASLGERRISDISRVLPSVTMQKCRPGSFPGALRTVLRFCAVLQRDKLAPRLTLSWVSLPWGQVAVSHLLVMTKSVSLNCIPGVSAFVEARQGRSQLKSALAHLASRPWPATGPGVLELGLWCVPASAAESVCIRMKFQLVSALRSVSFRRPWQQRHPSFFQLLGFKAVACPTSCKSSSLLRTALDDRRQSIVWCPVLISETDMVLLMIPVGQSICPSQGRQLKAPSRTSFCFDEPHRARCRSPAFLILAQAKRQSSRSQVGTQAFLLRALPRLKAGIISLLCLSLPPPCSDRLISTYSNVASCLWRTRTARIAVTSSLRRCGQRHTFMQQKLVRHRVVHSLEHDVGLHRASALPSWPAVSASTFTRLPWNVSSCGRLTWERLWLGQSRKQQHGQYLDRVRVLMTLGRWSPIRAHGSSTSPGQLHRGLMWHAQLYEALTKERQEVLGLRVLDSVSLIEFSAPDRQKQRSASSPRSGHLASLASFIILQSQVFSFGVVTPVQPAWLLQSVQRSEAEVGSWCMHISGMTMLKALLEVCSVPTSTLRVAQCVSLPTGVVSMGPDPFGWGRARRKKAQICLASHEPPAARPAVVQPLVSKAPLRWLLLDLVNVVASPRPCKGPIKSAFQVPRRLQAVTKLKAMPHHLVPSTDAATAYEVSVQKRSLHSHVLMRLSLLQLPYSATSRLALAACAKDSPERRSKALLRRIASQALELDGSVWIPLLQAFTLPAAAACQLPAVSTAPRLRCHLAAARRVASLGERRISDISRVLPSVTMQKCRPGSFPGALRTVLRFCAVLQRDKLAPRLTLSWVSLPWGQVAVSHLLVMTKSVSLNCIPGVSAFVEARQGRSQLKSALAHLASRPWPATGPGVLELGLWCIRMTEAMLKLFIKEGLVGSSRIVPPKPFPSVGVHLMFRLSSVGPNPLLGWALQRKAPMCFALPGHGVVQPCSLKRAAVPAQQLKHVLVAVKASSQAVSVVFFEGGARLGQERSQGLSQFSDFLRFATCYVATLEQLLQFGGYVRILSQVLSASSPSGVILAGHSLGVAVALCLADHLYTSGVEVMCVTGLDLRGVPRSLSEPSGQENALPMSLTQPLVRRMLATAHQLNFQVCLPPFLSAPQRTFALSAELAKNGLKGRVALNDADHFTLRDGFAWDITVRINAALTSPTVSAVNWCKAAEVQGKRRDSCRMSLE